MAAVWADADCPVELAGPNALDPHGEPIPWPRERIAIPPGGGGDAARGWRGHRYCPCRGARSVRSLVPSEADVLARSQPRPRVVLSGRVWLENSESPRTWIVYLGQCPDCGRISWSVV